MYKVAILGCENSHADTFLRLIYEEKVVEDVEVIGVYSYDPEASEKMHEKYGVAIADNYDAFVGQIDGLIITARHGERHYEYAKPYLDSGIPMFIDKPITCTEKDAIAFQKDLETRGIQISGGSMCKFFEGVQKAKEMVLSKEMGKAYGGYLRAPYNSNNPHGGFYFYTQHLSQMMMEIFGYYPSSVRVVQNGDALNCLVRYPDSDVNLCFVDHNRFYYVGISYEIGFVGEVCDFAGCAKKEFLEFYDLLIGGKQKQSYNDFFAPVYLLNAMKRALENGTEEKIRYFEE